MYARLHRYVPLRLGKWFEGAGIPRSSVTELDWWQEVQHEDTKVTVACTPAQVRFDCACCHLVRIQAAHLAGMEADCSGLNARITGAALEQPGH